MSTAKSRPNYATTAFRKQVKKEKISFFKSQINGFTASIN